MKLRGSVIIPTRDRLASLKRAVRSILKLRPERWQVEIVVVDNNDEAAVSDDLRSYCDGHAGEGVRYLIEPSPGLTAARHRGAEEAEGDLLFFIDDDVEVSESWLEAVLKAFESDEVGLVGGPSVPHFDASVPPWIWNFIKPSPHGGWWCGWVSLLDIGQNIDAIDPVWIFGLNFSIRRELLLELGGFNPDLVPSTLDRWQGDGETGLAYKVKTRGIRCLYRHDALVQHHLGSERLNPGAFAKRARYQGVCDSFTAIRAGKPPSIDAPGPQTSLSASAEERSAWGDAAHELKASMAKAYNDGWQFHQREVEADPALLQWVRRDNFWQADIRGETAKTR